MTVRKEQCDGSEISEKMRIFLNVAILLSVNVGIVQFGAAEEWTEEKEARRIAQVLAILKIGD